MELGLLLSNLLSPPVLFFALGMLAMAVRSDLTIPEPLPKLFSLYLLWAIGFKGGYELQHAGLQWGVALPIIGAIGISCLLPVFAFPVLRKMFSPADACAIAASYGSVSVVTFITAQNFLAREGVEFGGYMVAALALMEAPAIVVAVVLYRGHQAKTEPTTAHPGVGPLVREAATGGPVFLLLGSLVAGVLSGEAGWATLEPFCTDIFHGVLVLFLLEAGMTASKQLRDLKSSKRNAVVTGLVLPIISAVVAIALARLMGLSVGDATLLTVLSASASYIAVPAAMRLAVPEANSGLYMPMSLGITFPFNIAIGIPLYLGAIRLLWPEAMGSCELEIDRPGVVRRPRRDASMDAPSVQIGPGAERFLADDGLRVGPTPLVELKGLDAGPCRVLAKLEHMNLTGSIKDRVASELITDAEASGRLRPGMTIVEGSSGNATIAIGAAARRRGYRVLAFVPRSMTIEKKRLHAAMGVQCEYFGTDPDRPFTNIRRDEAIALAAAQPDRYLCFDQFSNPVNIRAHERATGNEIWRQLRQLGGGMGGGIDRYFAGAGTGGSLVGVTKALRRPGRLPRMGVTLVDPEGSTLAARFNGLPPSERHQDKPDGLGERYTPANLDTSLVDSAREVTRQDAVDACGELAKKTGILGGPCTGFTLHAALQWCRNQTEQKTVLVLVCDRGENYLSDEQYADAIGAAYGFIQPASRAVMSAV